MQRGQSHTAGETEDILQTRGESSFKGSKVIFGRSILVPITILRMDSFQQKNAVQVAMWLKENGVPGVFCEEFEG